MATRNRRSPVQTNTKIAAPRKVKAPVTKVTGGRLLDLSVLVLALDAFYSYGVSLQGPEAKKAEAFLKRGVGVLRKKGSEWKEALEWYVHPLESRKDIRGITQVIRRHMKALKSGKVTSNIGNSARMLEKFYPWLPKNSDILNEVFESRASLARKLSTAVMNDNPLDRLHELAMIPSASSLTEGRNWVRGAAGLAGVAPSPTEMALVEAEDAKILGLEIKTVDEKASLEEPNSPVAIELKEEKAGLLETLEETISTSNNPDLVRLVSASAAAADNYAQVTSMGRKLGLSRPQEKAMLVSGKAIIAAGAGSGKTRVLAGKVAYLVQEKGIPLNKIIATSFSKKSADELKERIGDYGTPVEDKAKNIGTTHSVGGAIARAFDKSIVPGKPIIKGGDQAKLIKRAMYQVTLRAPGASPPDTSKGLFADFVPDPGGKWGDYWDALTELETFIVSAIGSAGDPLSMEGWLKYEGPRRGYADALKAVRTVVKKKLTPDKLEGWQKDFLNKWFGKAQSRNIPTIPYRMANQGGGLPVSDDDWWRLAGDLRQRRFARDTSIIIDPIRDAEYMFLDQIFRKTSARDEGMEADQQATWKIPANLWFNLGWPMFMEGDQAAQAVGPGRINTRMSKFTGETLSPEQAYGLYIAPELDEINGGMPYLDPANGLSMVETPEGGTFKESPPPFDALCAAVYGAYQWLKGEDEEYQGRIDFTDMLIKAVSVMRSNPRARKAQQSQYSHILVDEAQDQNQLQHTMFGLIAGYIDPETLEPNPDGSMTAETYALIGDDKQAIYAFRGADPEEFIRRSDTSKWKGDFKTEILETNYRSGGMIVGAANSLMKHQMVRDPETGEKFNPQIPMVCEVRADQASKGLVRAETVSDNKMAAVATATQIDNMISGPDAEFDLGPKWNKPSFGVATRTRAERNAFCLELVKRGIPYRAEDVNLFNNPTAKSMLLYLKFASSSNIEDINDAVLNLRFFPKFDVGNRFGSNVAKKAKGNYYDWLIGGGWEQAGPKEKLPAIQAYVENLRKVKEDFASLEPTAFVNNLLNGLLGQDGRTLIENLVDAVRNDEYLMDKLAEEGADERGVVAEDLIREEAKSPLEAIYNVLGSHGDIQNGLAFIEKLKRANDKLSHDAKDKGEPAVWVGTAHSWKGLECGNIFIPMAEGIFPSGYAQADYDLAQERRLAYVAITRGQESVTILDINSRGDKVLPPSRFITEACIPGADPGRTPRVGEPLLPKTAQTADELIDMWWDMGEGDY